MRKVINSTRWIGILVFLVCSCKVTLITGYDPLVVEYVTKMKRDFNIHYIKFKRALTDTIPGNIKLSNFQDYYDGAEVDVMLLKERTRFLGKKGQLVEKQLKTLDSTMTAFRRIHGKIREGTGDDARDTKTAVNSSMDAVLQLQEALKTTKGKSEK